jgi:phenylalanine-4-hydroxylase
MTHTLRIPEYLNQYVAEQNYELYSPIDHATWRYILRVSQRHFAKHAHAVYLDGLEQTGIEIERIPRIKEMDEKLKKFGWRAVVISGFIPSSIFMEFLSLGMLPIACDIRTLEHLEYTPSPDIVHEAAGHAPIIADLDYARFLKRFGEVARKAIYSREDEEIYQAVLNLSDIKEDPATSEKEIVAATERLNRAIHSARFASEATRVSRIGWWSFEYGLIRDSSGYKMFGAGLLSSVDESYSCLDAKVEKIPFGLACADMNFDITQPQPQLYFVDDFSELEKTISDISQQMAFKKGGMFGLGQALNAQTVTTVEFESGVQVSGLLKAVLTQSGKKLVCGANEVLDNSNLEFQNQTPVYLQFSGPVSLAEMDIEIPGQGVKQHQEGFGMPVGKLKSGQRLSDLTAEQLIKLKLSEGETCRLEFVSGVVVLGTVIGTCRSDKTGKNLLISFSNCSVTQGDDVLFDPAWGVFDLACGDQVVSVFGGAADRARYIEGTEGVGKKSRGQSSNVTDSNRDLLPLYADVRSIREGKTVGAGEVSRLQRIFSDLKVRFPNDWLLSLEILEVLKSSTIKNVNQMNLIHDLEGHLEKLARVSKTNAMLISRGRELLELS